MAATYIDTFEESSEGLNCDVYHLPVQYLAVASASGGWRTAAVHFRVYIILE